MRTTVRLPDDLLKAAKRRAVETGRTLTEVIAEWITTDGDFRRFAGLETRHPLEGS